MTSRCQTGVALYLPFTKQKYVVAKALFSLPEGFPCYSTPQLTIKDEKYAVRPDKILLEKLHRNTRRHTS